MLDLDAPQPIQPPQPANPDARRTKRKRRRVARTERGNPIRTPTSETDEPCDSTGDTGAPAREEDN